MSRAKGNVELDTRLTELKKINNKTIKQQMEYLDGIALKDSMYGNKFNKFIFIVCMCICISILIDILNNTLLMIVFALLVSIGYTLTVTKKADNYIKTYNIISMFNIFLTVILFIVISSKDPLSLFGFKINFILLFILFFAGDALFKYIKEKVYKLKRENV